MHTEQKVEAAPTDRPIFGLPVDARILFSNHKGLYKRSIEKRKTKLLRKLGFLTKFLDADEKIVFVATGCSPYTTLEQLTAGALWITLVKRALFVFTNKRLLHIPTTWSFRYRGSIAQILYQDCRQLHVKGGRLVAEYHNGRKEKFLYIPRRDRKIIKHFQFATSEADQRSENPQRNHLCPNCARVLRARTVVCPSCGLEFKNRATALTISVLLPGGGYFYVGHPFMGIGDALGETYLLIITLVALGLSLLGDGDAVLTFLIFLAALTIEKMVTIYHSNSFLSEFIPRNRKAILRGQYVQRAPAEQPPLPVPPEPERRPEEVLSVR